MPLFPGVLCSISKEIGGSALNANQQRRPLTHSTPGSGFKILVISKDSEQAPNIRLPAYSIQEGKGNLEIRFRWAGRQKAISSGTRSRREADSQAPLVLARWVQRKGAGVVSSAVAQAVEQFVNEQYQDRKDSTRDEVSLVLRRLQATYPDLSTLAQLTPERFRHGLGKFRGQAAAGYWTNILVITRKFCRWAVERGAMAADPTKGLPLPGKGRGKRREVWPEADLERLLEALPGRDREILTVMRWTGMDSGDVFRLSGRHFVRDEAGILTLRKRREKAKSDEETMVQPLSSRVRPLIEARLASGEWYGKGYASVRSFTASLLCRVKKVIIRLSLPRRDLKSLRHTYCTHHAERGVPVDVLRGWLGHARNSRTLEAYYLHRPSTARFMD